MLTDDVNILFLALTGTILLILIMAFFIAFIALYRRRQRKFESEQLRLQQEFSEELLRTQLEMNEQTLKTVSEEIHDNIGQRLTLAKMQLYGLSKENLEEQGATARELITGSLADLRNLSKNLNGDYVMREGMRAAVERQVEMVCKSTKIECRLEGLYPDDVLSQDKEIILFRCIQEAMTNAIKHSGATQLVLNVISSNSEMTITISDDGKGIPEGWEEQRGLGMDSLKKRAHVLRGKLKVDSKMGQGTKICINLPIHDQIKEPHFEHTKNSHRG